MSFLSAHLEPTPAHYTYLLVSLFLILYACFSTFIRNRLHLSEPPLALLFGIAFGPRGLRLLNPYTWTSEDNITQEAARLIVGLQVFSVGVELPVGYFKRHWKSVAMMLGPVMTFSWVVTTGLVKGVLGVEWTTAMIVAACLAPTDPVLAAAVLRESQFSVRVPRRLKNLLSAESGCNDGVSFPFLYIGILFAISLSNEEAIKNWVLSTLLWQCAMGLAIGLVIGDLAYRALKVVDKANHVDKAACLAFYLLMATLSIGIASLLGTDDFLVAFGAGYAFARDGWYKKQMEDTHVPELLDLLLNSSMFVYVGSSIVWGQFAPSEYLPAMTPWRLVGLLVSILLLRRIPIVLALKRFIPDIRTYREALFCGHFGPMGLGAVFLVIEARAQLETGTSLPKPHPPKESPHKAAIEIIWPVVLFIVMGSTLVHGLSVAAISVGGHYSRRKGERAPLLAQETEPLNSMVHDGDDTEESVSEESGSEHDR